MARDTDAAAKQAARAGGDIALAVPRRATIVITGKMAAGLTPNDFTGLAIASITIGVALLSNFQMENMHVDVGDPASILHA